MKLNLGWLRRKRWEVADTAYWMTRGGAPFVWPCRTKREAEETAARFNSQLDGSATVRRQQ